MFRRYRFHFETFGASPLRREIDAAVGFETGAVWLEGALDHAPGDVVAERAALAFGQAGQEWHDDGLVDPADHRLLVGKIAVGVSTSEPDV